MLPEVKRGPLFTFGVLLLALSAGCGGGSSTLTPNLSTTTPAEVRVETAEMFLTEAETHVEAAIEALAKAEADAMSAAQTRLDMMNVLGTTPIERMHREAEFYAWSAWLGALPQIGCAPPGCDYASYWISVGQIFEDWVIKSQAESDIARKVALEAAVFADMARASADATGQIASRVRDLADAVRVVVDFSEAGITNVDPGTAMAAQTVAKAAEMAAEEARVAAGAARTAAAAARTDATAAQADAATIASFAESVFQEFVLDRPELRRDTGRSSSFATLLAGSKEDYRARGIAPRIVAQATDMQPDQFPHDHAVTLDHTGNPVIDGFKLSTGDAPALGGGWTGHAFAREVPDDGSTRYISTVYGKVKALGGSTEYVTVYSHPDHLRFGWWLDMPNSYADTTYRFSAFAGGETPYPAGAVEALAGTATYQGPAAGVYVKRAPHDSESERGVFTATVRLAADFDANSPGGQDAVGIISGAVTDFRENGEALDDWVVKLTAGLETATAGGFTGRIGGRAGSREWETGNWGGEFFGRGDSATGHPGAVAGEFNAASGTPGRPSLACLDYAADAGCLGPVDEGFVGLSGAFGAHKAGPME